MGWGVGVGGLSNSNAELYLCFLEIIKKLLGIIAETTH